MKNLSSNQQKLFLASPKFCSIECAINYISNKDRSAFKEVNERIDFPHTAPKKAISFYIKEHENWEWNLMFKRKDIQKYIIEAMSIEEFMKLLTIKRNYHLRELIEKRKDLKKYIIETLSIKKAFTYTKRYRELKKYFFQRTDITNSDMLTYAEKLSDHWETTWKLLFQFRKTLTLEELVNYSKTTKDRYFSIQTALEQREDLKKYLENELTLEEILKYGEENNQVNIWKIILTRNDVQKYLSETLSVEKSLSFVGKMQWIIIWNIVLERPDVKSHLKEKFSLKEWLGYFERFSEWEHLFLIIKEKEGIENYIKKKAPKKYILDFAKKVENKYVWSLVIDRNDFLLEDLFSYKESIYGRDTVWDKALNKFKDMNISKKLNSFKKFKRKDIDLSNFYNLQDLDVENYFEILDPNISLRYLKSISHSVDEIILNNFQVQILLRKTLSSLEVLDLAKKYNVSRFWQIIFKRKDVNSHIQGVSIKDAIDFANDNRFILEKIFERPDITPEKAVYYAKKYDKEKIWEIIENSKEISDSLK